MATFQARVQGYVGTFTDTTSLTDWLTAGAKKLTNLIRQEEAFKYATSTVVPDAGLTVSNSRVLSAAYAGRGCRLVPHGLEAQATDTGSIWFALATDPCMFTKDSKLFVKPAGGGSSTIAQILGYPTVLYSDSSISGFPSYFEDAVVLYAVIRALSQQLNADIRTDEDLEKAETQRNMLNTVQAEYDRTLAMYFQPGKGEAQ